MSNYAEEKFANPDILAISGSEGQSGELHLAPEADTSKAESVKVETPKQGFPSREEMARSLAHDAFYRLDLREAEYSRLLEVPLSELEDSWEKWNTEILKSQVASLVDEVRHATYGSRIKEATLLKREALNSKGTLFDQIIEKVYSAVGIDDASMIVERVAYHKQLHELLLSHDTLADAIISLGARLELSIPLSEGYIDGSGHFVVETQEVTTDAAYSTTDLVKICLSAYRELSRYREVALRMESAEIDLVSTRKKLRDAQFALEDQKRTYDRRIADLNAALVRKEEKKPLVQGGFVIANPAEGLILGYRGTAQEREAARNFSILPNRFIMVGTMVGALTFDTVEDAIQFYDSVASRRFVVDIESFVICSVGLNAVA